MSTRDRQRANVAPAAPIDEDVGAATGLIEAAPAGPEEPASGLTRDDRFKSGKLAGLTMWGAIFTLGWPILAESYLASFVGLTDTILAAQISQGATDAIGGAAYILWFIGLVVQAIGVGATALVARSVGAGRWAVAHAATAQALIMGVAAGALVAALIIAVAGPMASALSLRGDAHAGFVIYLRVVALSVPAIAIVACGIACCRGAGDSIRPLLAMVTVNVVNIAASWVLSGVDLASSKIVGGEVVRTVFLRNPFEFNLGIAGIAWGTVVAQYAGALVVLWILARGLSGIRLKRRWLRPHKPTVARVARLGFTNFLESAGMWVGNFLIVLMVGWMSRMPTTIPGSAEPRAPHEGGLIGSHIVAARIEALSYLPGFAIGVAAATLVGQYLGARRPEMARIAVSRCMVVTSLITGVAGACFILFPRALVGLVSGQPAHLEQVPPMLIIAGFVQIPFGVGNVLRAALRGAGDVRAVMWIIWVCTYAVRLPLAYALSGVALPIPAWAGGGHIENPFRDHASLTWLWAALSAELVIRSAILLWRFRGEAWLSKRV